jgi:hypothetical protein
MNTSAGARANQRERRPELLRPAGDGDHLPCGSVPRKPSAAWQRGREEESDVHVLIIGGGTWRDGIKGVQGEIPTRRESTSHDR